MKEVSEALAHIDTQTAEATLAQANLMRLRGQLTEAKTLLESLLKQKTDYSDANLLIGDICEEMGRHEEARLWFLHAADCGASESASRRLKQLDERLHQEHQVRLLEVAEIKQSNLTPVYWTLVGLVAAAAMFALYWLLNPRPIQVADRIVVPISVPAPSEPVVVRETTPAPEPKPLPAPKFQTQDERLIFDTLQSSWAHSALIQSVQYDPRSSIATLTLTASPETKLLDLGTSALLVLPDIRQVTIRQLANDQLVGLADYVRGEGGAVLESNLKNYP